MNKIRLDLFLVSNGYCQTRSQAQQLISFNSVYIDNIVAKKANILINPSENKISVEKLKYVSRAGIKLEHALKTFNIDVKNKVILDIGTSTGGFTDCCIQLGAKFIYGVDVGHNQLSEKLINHKKIKLYEKTNLKDINILKFDFSIDLVVCDVSFISLKYVFEAIKNLYNNNLDIVVLIKPQFELDEKTMKKNKGFVKSDSDRKKAINNVIEYAKMHHLKFIQIVQSPITGNKKNNIEYLGYFKWIG